MKLVPSRNEDLFPTGFGSWLQRVFDNGPLAAWSDWPVTSRLPETFARGNVPAVNVAETDKELTVTVELPGLDEKDIQVSCNGNLLTIQAERKFEEEKKDKHYHRTELQYGTFTRTLSLPVGLRTTEIDARYKNGILTLAIPKVEPTPTTKVKVKTG